MDLDFDVDCPVCDAPATVTVSDVAEQRKVSCRLGHAFELVDEGGGAAQVDKTMKDLDKALRDLGRP